MKYQISKPRRSRLRPTGPMVITIQGEPYNKYVAEKIFICWMCEAPLKACKKDRANYQGLQCTANSDHYGQILKSEAAKLTRGELMTKMSEIWKNTTGKARFFDVPVDGAIWTIKGSKMISQWTPDGTIEVFCLTFEENDLGVKITKTKGGQQLGVKYGYDSEDWIGWPVKVFGNPEKNFGKDMIVVRIAITNLPRKLSPKQEPGKVNTVSRLMVVINENLKSPYYKNHHQLETIVKNAMTNIPKPDDKAGWQGAYSWGKYYASPDGQLCKMIAAEVGFYKNWFHVYQTIGELKLKLKIDNPESVEAAKAELKRHAEEQAQGSNVVTEEEIPF